MFEQYAQALHTEVPHLSIEGSVYPPPRINELLSSGMFILRMAIILALLVGPGALESIGIQNPPWIYTWAQENKVCVMWVPHTHQLSDMILVINCCSR